MASLKKVPGFELQRSPKVIVTMISGKWLLARTTPTWRIDDPEKGFQRVVKERRAREIAIAVLDQHRSFPNAIVLATDRKEFTIRAGKVELPNRVKFLVVDGQHRLWAQKFSQHDAEYACMIHLGLSEVQMAKLFLEINDNQKRVPSSLRWDLVRLVRPDDDPFSIAAAEMVRELTEDKESPLYQRIDLTGEQSEIQLKQGSVAPELRKLVSKRSPLYELSFDEQYGVVLQYMIALRRLDGRKWGRTNSSIYKARVLRAFLQILPEIVRREKLLPVEISSQKFYSYLRKVDESSLDPNKIRAAQGSAGIRDIRIQLAEQIFAE